jgi:hypothetical protein
MHFSSPPSPNVPHAQPISSSSIWSPYWYVLGSSLYHFFQSPVTSLSP